MRDLFQQLAKIPFDVVGNVTQAATYHVIEDDGFGTASTTDYSCKIVIDENSTTKIFGDLMEVTDSIGYVYSTSCNVPLESGNELTDIFSQKYSIESSKVDAAGACFTLLLRKIAG